MQALAAGYNQTIDNVLKAILDFYMTERALVLSNIQLVLRYSSPLVPPNNRLSTLVHIRDVMLRGKNGVGLVENLIAGLDRNLQWNVREFGQVPLDESQRAKILDYLQAE